MYKSSDLPANFRERSASQIPQAVFQDNPASRRMEIMPWIRVAPGAPYFVTETGGNWTPIGQNDAITWPELAGLFRGRDAAPAERYLAMLAGSGVTVLRLMLEYCHGEHRYFEKPAGRMVPQMVRLWDDLFALCERHGLRILLTPFDTFWTWIRWKKHPYNQANGGPCSSRSRLLICPATRQRIKERLFFATERWGGSGALFAWDIWNEIHSSHAEGCPSHLSDFIEDVSTALRSAEIRLHGRAHPQTISVFGPHLASDARVGEAVFRHPSLDFASTHFYEQGTIDFPRNTIAPAVSTGRLTRLAMAETPAGRPFFESEHGPIHTFKDRRITLPEAFDDEYFRHMQWAHFASGGAGGGMRWPNRHPHSLTPGMRRAQRGLADFLPLIEWSKFQRRNLNAEATAAPGSIVVFACGDAKQALVWMLRTDGAGRHGMLRRDLQPVSAVLKIPGLQPGTFHITPWDTESGSACETFQAAQFTDGNLIVQTAPFARDLALAIRRIG